MDNGICQCKNEGRQKCECNEGYTGKYCQRRKSDNNYCKPILPCVVKKAYQIWNPEAQDLIQEMSQTCEETSQNSKIFGNNLYIACDLSKETDPFFTNMTKLHLYTKDRDCETALEKYKKENENAGPAQDQEDPGPNRGDMQAGDSVLTIDIKARSLKTCIVQEPAVGCYFRFHHTGIGSDDYFGSNVSTF